MTRSFIFHSVVCPAFLIVSLLAFLRSAEGGPAIDRVVLEHPGYIITVVSTAVRIDFVLNQKGLPRTEIERGYLSYPRERFRRAGVNTAATTPLFTLVRSREFASVGSAYVAPAGTFAYYGHRVTMILTLYSRSTPARRVTFDSSRQQDWPPPLKRAVDEIFRLGRLTGPLPAGPVIE